MKTKFFLLVLSGWIALGAMAYVPEWSGERRGEERLGLVSQPLQQRLVSDLSLEAAEIEIVATLADGRRCQVDMSQLDLAVVRSQLARAPIPIDSRDPESQGVEREEAMGEPLPFCAQDATRTVQADLDVLRPMSNQVALGPAALVGAGLYLAGCTAFSVGVLGDQNFAATHSTGEKLLVFPLIAVCSPVLLVGGAIVTGYEISIWTVQKLRRLQRKRRAQRDR